MIRWKGSIGCPGSINPVLPTPTSLLFFSFLVPTFAFTPARP